ncbi:hypothetical protein CFOL_v3_07404 [Cephalotus follicularis]|uniref:START domain-containing protein n=1 Tax=Cephalotus follicularis TaxID=3775 RepID=A0A1Q3B768_CEPFO|nr:hypothetical protein CFOL_v3_07404 [Cephalotus follicularis]
MEKKPKISQYREKMDKSLASAELTNVESLRTLVKNQLLSSSQHANEGCMENLIEKRTSEVSNLLDMLRSASVKDHELSAAAHGEWKLKQDNEEFRVMYREGPLNSPFHTLLIEGYVDGPLDVCLCVFWESALYNKWWPQTKIPPFKINICKCLQKIQIGEQISLVRVKLMWPLSSREAVVHYFLFEYFQDDLVVALVNSIPDLDSVDKSIHGFTNNGIPEESDVVRIDFVGGCAIQKVTSKRNYFRSIANMDIKLDFVPPSLINFISRQLMGSGFRLYVKSVDNASNNDEDFRKALGDPLYARVRKALYSSNEPNSDLSGKELNSDTCCIPVRDMSDGLMNMEQKVHINDSASKSLPKSAEVKERKVVGEIEEEKSADSRNTNTDIDKMESEVHSTNHAAESSLKRIIITDGKAFGEIEEEESEDRLQVVEIEEVEECIDPPLANNGENCRVKGKKEVLIRPEVEQALGILENAISIIHEYRLNTQIRPSAGFTNEEPTVLAEKGEAKDSTSLEHGGVCSNGKLSKKDITEKTSHDSSNSSGIHSGIHYSRHVGSYSYSKEVNRNRIAPASLEECFSIPIETNQISLSSSINGTTNLPIFDQTSHDNKHVSATQNGTHGNGANEEKKLYKQKKHRLCCFTCNSGISYHRRERS